MACTGALASAAPPLNQNRRSGVGESNDSHCSTSLGTTSPTISEQEKSYKFTYGRASPSVRWPHLKLTDVHRYSPPTQFIPPSPSPDDSEFPSNKQRIRDYESSEDIVEDSSEINDEALEQVLGRPNRCMAKKMTKLALKRAKDWRKRVQYLTDKILALNSEEFVADVLDDRKVQMTPTDFGYVVKWVGKSNWQRALEIYEWLNLRRWYSPNPRMLATILSVLGRANQESLATEIFTRTVQGVGNVVQVYNAMMGVYARNGWFEKVQQMLDEMREQGCEPDLVSFNTLINARFRSGSMGPNMAFELLNLVRKSGLRPDTITYNTLISACSKDSNLEEAIKIFEDMEKSKCQPDLWTYNAILSVYGRCGMSSEAERLFKELEKKGFLPDAVTYNSLLYAFAKEGNVEKVEKLCKKMVKMGFGEDEMTYNTIIHMYGKQGRHDLALQLYKEMKSSGKDPDVVTYTILIDSLGKANKMNEAANLMSEMLDSGIKPALRTYSALICGYAKSGMRLEAGETFDCMLRSGIKPDSLAYSVMLDIYLRSSEITKAMGVYNEMVRCGFTPDFLLYEFLLRSLVRDDKQDCILKVMSDLEEICKLSPQVISSVLINGGCYGFAAKMLRLSISQGYDLDRENLLSVLSSLSSSGRHSEAMELLDFLKENAFGSNFQLVSEALILILCNNHQLDDALVEYRKSRNFNQFGCNYTLYASLIKCCEQAELFSEASQVFSDMKFVGVEPCEDIYVIMSLVYCKMGIPETTHFLIEEAEAKGMPINDVAIYVSLIEAYGKLNLLEKAESVVGSLRERNSIVDRKAWNALIQAYAAKGFYEKARAVFNTMMRDGPSPTVDSINGLMEALVNDGRLKELYVVVQELQDMGFKISKSSIVLMLDAFAQAGDIFEVNKIYHGMSAAGYFPTMHLYRVMICLLCRGKRVRDAEAMVAEMIEVGFKPDLCIWNSLLKLYTKIEDYRKTVEIYQKIREAGLKPDEETYNILILMYCRDQKPEEGLLLLEEMKRVGLDAKLDSYKSLVAALGKLKLVEQAEGLFGKLRLGGHKMDRSFYHLMMKMYRSLGEHSKAENLLFLMKEMGIEPTIHTMHLLMISYGSSGNPLEAEEVLNNLKSSGENLSTLPYSSVIDAYLKHGDYDVGVQKLFEMKREGPEPDHRIWTCFVRAASLCTSKSEAVTLLNAIGDAGFDLPIKLLTKYSESTMVEIDQYLEKLEPVDDNAAFNFVNSLEDLLWAFQRRATASWVFQLAIKKNIYRHDVFRVADKDWGADFRKLSAGAALVGLTLWLDHMQDASLEGFPESPKSVVLITGTSEYNNVSLNSTLKAYLWEMGSPFYPCKTRSGLLVAKAHSLRMWLKDSPFCMDLELKNSDVLPETNSMELIEGCYIRKGLVPAFKDISERLGQVRPKKFARLALLSDEKRDQVIRADIEGRKEKLAKLEKFGVSKKNSVKRFRKRRLWKRRVAVEG